MRQDDALTRCTIIQFKLVQGPETVAFCVPDAVLFDPFRKSLAKSLDRAAGAADINNAIASASKEDIFEVTYSDKDVKIQFGEKAV